jgi:hypothetical protein
LDGENPGTGKPGTGDRKTQTKNPGTKNLGTSMISKSQEETEVSLHLEDWGLEAKVVRLS